MTPAAAFSYAATTTGIREQLDATTQAMVAAHDADLSDPLAGVQWERRGLLQRLVRRPLV